MAYIDWKQQEFGIAAALSGDEAMQAAYITGDPYLAFAKQAGDVPEDGTKQSHPQQRALFKACVLGLQYGMGAYALAQSINKQTAVARRLLRLNQELYPTFWRFSDTVLDHTLLTGRVHTVLGWQQYFANDPNPRAIRNFPMQANGAEMLRLACCRATEADVEVVAPVHDAVMITSSVDRIEEDVTKMQAAMASASRTILGGFELTTDVDIVRWPGRFMDEDRGRAMWDKIMMIPGRR